MQTGTIAQVRQDIADVLIEHALGVGEFIGLKAMPVFPTRVKNGKFLKLAFDSVLTKADNKRAPGGHYNEVQHETTYDTFDCVEYGLEEAVDDGEGKLFANYFDAEVAAADQCQYNNLLEQEARLAAILFDSSTTFSSYTTAVSSKWSDATNATPVSDVASAIEKIRANIQGRMNGSKIVGLCNDTTIRMLKTCNDIKNRALYAARGLENFPRTQDGDNPVLASVLGLDALYDSAIKRNGSVVWATSKFGIYLVNSAANIRAAASVGRTMLWTEDSPDNALVETYRDETRRSNIVRVRQHVDEKLLTARCGYVLTNIQ